MRSPAKPDSDPALKPAKGTMPLWFSGRAFPTGADKVGVISVIVVVQM
jgi:hypothetical protein